MRTITTYDFLGNEITVSLAEYMTRWEDTTSINDLKNLCFTANQTGDVYERLSQIEQELILIREQLVLDTFNKLYKRQN